MKPKVSRGKEIKIRVEINEVETIKKQRITNETKSQFFIKINKSDKPLASLTRKKRKNTKIIKIENESISTNLTEIKRIIREYYEQLYQKI